jgi:cytochrome c peroxidase
MTDGKPKRHRWEGIDTCKARGQAFLDLVGGTISVEVSGFPEEQALDVWLIDNRPGPGHSVKPEPGDAMVRLGHLKHAGGRAALEARLGPEAISGFEIDLVVVARAGEDPGKASLLFGSPSLFQRLYHSELREQFARRGEVGASRSSDPADQSLLSSPFRVLIPSPVYAQHTKGKPDLGSLVAKGEDLFFNEEFDGNGRTCGTCHPAENNLTIDPVFISTLPPTDPLFVAENNPALNFELNGGKRFEIPELMRKLGLILENVDGFENLEEKFTMRGVPHLLGISTSLDPPTIPFDNSLTGGIDPPAQRTGWSGDGAPGSGSLRDFATGAVVQHFPLTLNRVPGVDFRLPTDAELDAMEAFQLSLGRQQELNLNDMTFTDLKVTLGVVLFNRLDTSGGALGAGKCSLCHENLGANINSTFFTNLLGTPFPVTGNANFGTAVNDLPNLLADLIDASNNPRDGEEGFGFGTVTPPGGALPPGLCEEDFNTPSLVEAADTGPFFHNNAVETIEAAVAFYNDDAFNQSAGGTLLAAIDSGGIGIKLASTEVTAIAALLRTVNALDNIEFSNALLERAKYAWGHTASRRLQVAKANTEDAIDVLKGGALHPGAVKHLEQARGLIKSAGKRPFIRRFLIKKAIAQQKAARGRMVKKSK